MKWDPSVAQLYQKRKDTPKRFGIVPEFVSMKTDCFDFGPESAFLDQIEMISFDKTNSAMNSNDLV